MKTNTSPRKSTLVKILALSLGLLVAGISISAQATALWWDTNGTTGGSGAATGTWGSSTFWNTDSTGGTAPGTTNTTTSDDLTFSAGTNGSSGTVTLSGTGQGANSITFSQSGAVTVAGSSAATLNLAANAVITVNNAADTMNVLLSGSNITKSGSGTLVSTNNLTQAALNGLTIENGTFSLGGGNNSGLGPAGSTVNLGSTGNNATLLFTAGVSTLAPNFVIGGSGTSALNNSSSTLTNVAGTIAVNNTLHVSASNAAGGFRLSGNITGASGIVIDATNVATVNIRGSNGSFSGGITVLSGTLTNDLDNANSAFGSGQVILGDTSGSANVVVSLSSNTQAPAGGYLVRSGSGGTVTFTNASGKNAIYGGASSSIALQKDVIFSVNSGGGSTRIAGAITGTANITVSISGGAAGSNAVFTQGSGVFNNTGTITNNGTGAGVLAFVGDGALGPNVTALTQNSGTSFALLSSANSGFAGTVNVQLGNITSNNNGRTMGTSQSINVGAITGSVSATNFTSLTLGNFTQQIHETATLSLAGGGVAATADTGFVTLNNTVSQQVGGLVLGGVAQLVNGTYGSTTSAATFQNNEYFIGNGVINLIQVPEPGTWVMLIGGVGMLVLFRRRRS